ncbi:hypothetical protein BDF22DRAFT_699057 [Syncephalis plumigaleata]|nr:hypothetical protein BDF22DRAFT_699057 [Syncephalis plumigaleata]
MRRAELRETLTSVFRDMSNGDPHTQAEAIYRAYTEDAVYEHPLMICRGIHNIIKAQETWTSLFHDECQIDNIIIDDLRVVVSTCHTIVPKMLPFVKVPLCKSSVLELRPTLNDCVRIDRQVDNVVISDTMAQFPIAGWFINNLIRPAAFQGWAALGTALGTSGHSMHSSSETGTNASGRNLLSSGLLSTAMLRDLAAPYIDWAKERLGLARSSSSSVDDDFDQSSVVAPHTPRPVRAGMVIPQEK